MVSLLMSLPYNKLLKNEKSHKEGSPTRIGKLPVILFLLNE